MFLTPVLLAVKFSMCLESVVLTPKAFYSRGVIELIQDYVDISNTIF